MQPKKAWNETTTEFPDKMLIHELFEAQAKKTPSEIAVIDGKTKISYKELSDLSAKLAGLLIKNGLNQDSIVGCYLDKSLSVVVCMLAILKAGASYLLIDSNLPKKRVEYIVEDAKPHIILIEKELPVTVSENIRVLKFKKIVEDSREIEYVDIKAKQDSSTAAYMAYTSGSTGNPKGVIVSHRSTVNHALAFSKIFKLKLGERVPLMSPIAFDVCIEEIIPPLVSGCTLIVSKILFNSMGEFTEEIDSKNYSLLNIPSSLWQQWVQYLTDKKLQIPNCLKVVIVGSEEIETKYLNMWKKLNGSQNILWAAAYGTAETTVTSTLYIPSPDDDLHSEPYVPIGKPIANTFAYILKEDLSSVDVGEEGELFIGGEGLALGYHNREKLNEDKFLKDIYSKIDGARMYKTGDLARFRPDGNIAWLGRKDFQIKLRGLRIEPEEIESILNLSPNVLESVVVLRKAKNPADNCLVAFVVTKNSEMADQLELRKLAFHYLPTLMVPEMYLTLKKWPKNLNGKIDRKTLEKVASSIH